MADITAVLDACVLYPAPLRDLLLRLASHGLFRARWTEEIHKEWMSNLLANRPDLTPDQLQRTRELMDKAVPDCLVEGHKPLIETLDLPDANDRHILAAAIRCQAKVIITFNLADFPVPASEPYGIEAQHPDEFILNLMDLDFASVCSAVRKQRRSLSKPPLTPRELLETCRAQMLVGCVARLEEMIDFL